MDKDLSSVIIAVVICSTIIVGIIAQALVSRRKQGPHAPQIDALSARLERMEHAIDSIAIEMERVSESQRFTTRVLAERGEVPQPRSPGRVITPH